MVNLAKIDQGVREIVDLLNNNGFVTTDSGDGYSKPPEGRTMGDFAHVWSKVPLDQMIAEADRMQALLDEREPEDKRWRVEASYAPIDGREGLLLAVEFKDID